MNADFRLLTRDQPMAGREGSAGPVRHSDARRAWFSGPIQPLIAAELRAHFRQKPKPWGGDNGAIFTSYASAANGECPLHTGASTPNPGNARFARWGQWPVRLA